MSAWSTSKRSASSSAAAPPTSRWPRRGWATAPALISGVGDDPFGTFVRAELAELGVDNRYVATHGEYPTPVTFCEIFPPDNFPLYFYRRPSAPDLQIQRRRDRRRRGAVRPAVLVDGDWSVRRAKPQRTFRRLGSTQPGPVHGARPRLPADVLGIPGRGHRAGADAHCRHVTVAVGNREECEIAVGETNPHKAADALLDLGVELAIVKQGPRGVLGKTRHSSVTVAPNDVDVVNGLGAGDAFGGSLCHGLLHGWPLEKTLRYANAAGAIVASRLECSTAMPTAAEVAALAEQTAVEAVNV